jgi:O-antigen ligase
VFGWSVVALIIVGVGRITEFVPGLQGAPLAKVAVGVAVLAYLNGRAQHVVYPAVMSTPFGRTAAALGVLAVSSLLFSVWKSRTLQIILESIPIAAEFWLISCAVSDWRSIRRLSAAIAVAAGALAITALLSYSGGRAAVQSSYDTNDLAYVMVAALPIGYGLGMTSKGLRRTVWLALCAALVITTILTGSRGGAIGLGAVVLCLLTTSATRPRRQNGKTHLGRVLVALVVLALVAVLSWPMLPEETRERFATFSDLGSDYNMQSGHDSRIDIWERSMKSLLGRPIGFGWGAFGVVDMSTGGQFRAAHNSEVQIAVELGFLGLFLYLRMYWLSWTALGRLVELGRAPGAEASRDAVERGIMAANLRVSLIGNFSAGFFLSQAYSNIIWLLFGLIAGMAIVALPPKVSARSVARA